MKYIFPVPVIILFLFACENPITFVWDVTVETDASQYTLPASALISISNNSESPVDVRVCNDGLYVMLQRRVGIQWNTVYRTSCPDGEAYETLPAGQSVQYTVDLVVLDSAEGQTGIFRFESIIYPGNDRRLMLPGNMRISNTFSIVINEDGDNNS